MMAPADWPESFHGEQIGIATLTMARLQERLLAEGPPRLSEGGESETDFKAHFGAELGATCWREFAAKRQRIGGIDALNERLAIIWDEARTRMSEVAMGADELEAVLRRAGAPTRPADIGWPEAFYQEAVRRGRQIRDRYTFLDLAADSGGLNDPSVF
jgi:glycerol-1-phosphate dehydrogenase [NAD(P)+]